MPMLYSLRRDTTSTTITQRPRDILKLDNTVAQLLRVDPENTSVTSAGGGGCSSASTLKITSRGDDGEKTFFMKTGKGEEAEIMFEGEHASLNAVNDAVPSLCPRSFGHGRFESDPSTSFLVTEFLHLTGRHHALISPSKNLSLASKLAQLHTTPAPIPNGHTKPMFGFPVTTCCGDTPQENSFKESWADFYAENRLRFILRRGEKQQGKDAKLHALVETTASEIVPRLLSDTHLNNGQGITPVVVHGDLWSGNTSVGAISGRDGPVQDVTYDSSACYAHSEYELGDMKMFGGFSTEFMQEYHALCPKSEPVGEYADRVSLYELYHHLNHWAMFGGGYRGGAVRIMETLVAKYG